MDSKTTINLRSLLPAFITGVITILIARRVQFLNPLPDSDQFYHFAISRLMLERGLLHRLPEVAGLFWGDLFPEKEFLFHQLTALAFSIGGESAIKLTIAICAAFTTAILSYYAGKLSGKFWVAAAFTILLLPLDAFFIHRLFLVRPHVLAVLIYSLLLCSILSKNKYWVFISCFLFALSYHAIYVPLAILCSLLLVYSFKSESSESRACAFSLILWGGVGLVASSILYPNFPAQLRMMWEHLAFAIGSHAEIGIGSDVVALGFLDTIYRSVFLYTLTSVALAIQLLRYSKLSKQELFILLSTIIFLVVTFKNPRGVEYLIPLVVLLIAQILSLLARGTSVAFAGVVIFFGIATVPKISWFGLLNSPVVNQGRLAALRAASAIERDSTVEKKAIFNCSFNTGAYVLYAVPNATLIDLLDPRFLIVANPALFEARAKIVQNPEGEIVSNIKSAFAATHVICRRGPLTTALDQNPNAKRLYPQDTAQHAAVMSYSIFGSVNE